MCQRCRVSVPGRAAERVDVTLMICTVLMNNQGRQILWFAWLQRPTNVSDVEMSGERTGGVQFPKGLAGGFKAPERAQNQVKCTKLRYRS